MTRGAARPLVVAEGRPQKEAQRPKKTKGLDIISNL